MTETDVSPEPQPAPRQQGGLSTKLMPELKQIAAGLGIKTAGMKKADLVGAIRAAQTVTSSQQDRRAERPATAAPEIPQQDRTAEQPAPREDRAPRGQDRAASQRPARTSAADQGDRQSDGDQQGAHQNDQQGDRQSGQPDDQSRNGSRNQARNEASNEAAADQPKDQPEDRSGQQAPDEEGGSRRNRRRRGRDRADRNERTDRTDRNERTDRQPTAASRNRNEPDTSILEDDVLSPCAGILDVLDNYAFVRTTGYLPGPDDVYVSLSMVRKLGLRRGDAITGQVRQPREGERKEKFNPLVKIDSVNGGDPEASRERVEFSSLTPLHPSERLRMETTHDNLVGRLIDIAAPIGKGQRGLVVAPAKAGKTTVLKSIANSVSANHPECHVMVVLVDERPEEVTDFQRSVTGEVIASTFDRPATDHTTVAELAIERAKRLVELGHDVVVLLDGITRLGRAFNVSAPTSGRVLAGTVDPAALYPPKKFFGAARNIEGGGSLTIVATALVESGSTMDEVIFEEFKGTGNMELRLRGEIADRRVFPAVDAVASGTLREEMLMSSEELAIVWKLRRVLSSLDPQQALELLLGRLRKTQNNHEFLRQVEKTNGGAQE